ncbi:LysR family transcriptional regulator [Alteromonas sp. 1_MG-2023]|uniref:LysR family transcriptional regulator n=1 Tax=Alteromonas sp. 1_MG-2023 TaxID=3062669 RepID=UPI0026E1F745|nr:LysR family transcriptional regulator [Alteromonas sp. 1_MG-2023]MDO6477356.1 LysR family transcriptional regulator [Alteromonas sp. 1_MG-2023]
MALFVEVCKTMSFRKAADALDMPSSTLSRRVSHLEKEVGLRLLHRTTRKVELTEAGLLYYQRCKRIVDEAKLAHEQLGEMLEHPSGTIKASVPVDFAIIYIAPLLSEFSSIYPGIKIEFDMTPRNADLVSEHVDLAIRMGQPADSSLIARKITSLTSQLYASPEYIRRCGYPSHPSELIQHEGIAFPKIECWDLRKDEHEIRAEFGGRYRANNVGMMKRLATLHQGVILLPETSVSEELMAGKLIPILPEWKGSTLPVYALTETRLLPAKVRVFIDFIQQKLG